MGQHFYWHPKSVFVSPEFESDYIVSRYGQSSWQYKVVKYIHSHHVQVFLAVLLFLDVACLVAELLLSSIYPECVHVLEFCAATDLNETSARLLSSQQDSSAQCGTICLPHPHWLHDLHVALFSISIVILIIFEIELLLLLAAVKLLFFRVFFYVLDFSIVTTAIALEAYYFTLSDKASAEAVGLLVLLRVWRFIRLGHAIGTDVHEYEHHKIETLKEQVAELQAQVALMRNSVTADQNQKQQPDPPTSATSEQQVVLT